METTLSTTIDTDLKNILKKFCKSEGLKIRHVIERAILEYIEDEIDIKAYKERKNEERFSLEDVLAKR